MSHGARGKPFSREILVRPAERNLFQAAASQSLTESRHQDVLSQILPADSSSLQLGSLSAAWRSLSQESNPEIFFQDLLSLGYQSQSQGNRPLARRIFSALNQNKQVSQAIARSAGEALDALEGRGPLGPQLESWTQDILHEALSPPVLGGMFAAGFFYRLGRLGAASALVGRGFHPTALRASASGAGILAESGGFVLGTRGVATYLGQAPTWDGASLGEAYRSALTLFLGLRLAGAGMTGLHGSLAQSSRVPGLIRRLPQGGFTQAGMFLGIAGTQFYENSRNPLESQGTGEVLANSLKLWLSFNVAGAFFRALRGPSLARWEQRLDSQITQMENSRPNPLFHGLPGLVPAGANGPIPSHYLATMSQGPRASETQFEPTPPSRQAIRSDVRLKADPIETPPKSSLRVIPETDIPRRIHNLEELQLLIFSEGRTYPAGQSPPIILVSGQVEISQLNQGGRGKGSRIPSDTLLELWVPENQTTFMGKKVLGDIQWTPIPRTTWSQLEATANHSILTSRNPLHLYLQIDAIGRIKGRNGQSQTRIKYHGESWGDSLVDMITEPLNQLKISGSRLVILPQGAHRMPMVFRGHHGQWTLAHVLTGGHPGGSNGVRPPLTLIDPVVNDHSQSTSPTDPAIRLARNLLEVRSGINRLLRPPGNGITREVFWEDGTPLSPQHLQDIQMRLAGMIPGRRLLVHDTSVRYTYEFAKPKFEIHRRERAWEAPEAPNPLEVRDISDLLMKLKFLESGPRRGNLSLEARVQGIWNPQMDGRLLMESLSHRSRFPYREILIRYGAGQSSPRFDFHQQFLKYRNGSWNEG